MAIPRYTQENYGSLIRIAYVPTWQVSSFTPSGRGKITAAGIVLLAGYGWQDIYCSQDTMGHRQTQDTDANGERWAQSIVGFIPGDEDLIEAGLQDLYDQRYLVRCTFPNGTIRICGTPKYPLDFKMDSNSQTTVPGTPGTSIQFGGYTGNRALVLEA